MNTKKSIVLQYPDSRCRILEFEADHWNALKTHEWFFDLLRRSHAGKFTIRCGCRRGEGRTSLPTVCTRRTSGGVNFYRRRIHEHHQDQCPLVQIREARARPKLISPAVFQTFHRPRSIKVRSKSRTGGARKLTGSWDFDSAITNLVATADLRTFNELNPGFGELIQPNVCDLMKAIEVEAQSEKFKGKNSAKSAAMKQGCSLVFGLIVSGRGHVRKDLNCVVADWFTGNRFDRWAHYCSEEVMAKALKACIHDHRSIVPPPYLACALIEPDGEIRRLWLRPIWLSSNGYALVESEIERRAWNIQNFRKHVFFRPIREEDTERLALLKDIEDEALLGHKWDMIRFEKIHLPSSRISPTEIYGYREGSNRDYDRRRALGESRMNRLLPPFKGDPIEGLDIDPSEYEEWKDLGLVFGPTIISEALRGFLMPTLEIAG